MNSGFDPAVRVTDSSLLVVDDNEDNRYTLTGRLRKLGYTNISVACNGREALDMMAAQSFDLVLLDVMMPELNGYEVLERLKADSRLRDLPVIMISAVDQIESVVRCIELGAEEYLPKPFNPTLLRARVGACLEKKRLRDAVKANLSRLENELLAARRLQLDMLPRDFPHWSTKTPLDVHARMEPAREVGGDLYDFFFASPSVFCCMVGDVSGKGAAAAMFMARTRSLVRMAMELLQRDHPRKVSPAIAASAVNRELCQDNRERMFVTLLLCFIDLGSGAVSYVNAGHPVPYLIRSVGSPERLAGRPDAPLGVDAATDYENRTETLLPGDVVFLYTDGVTEATNAGGEFYSDHRLQAALERLSNAKAEHVVRTIEGGVAAFVGGTHIADDVTMLAVRWLPGAG